MFESRVTKHRTRQTNPFIELRFYLLLQLKQLISSVWISSCRWIRTSASGVWLKKSRKTKIAKKLKAETIWIDSNLTRDLNLTLDMVSLSQKTFWFVSSTSTPHYRKFFKDFFLSASGQDAENSIPTADLKLYYIAGPVFGSMIIFLIGWYIRHRRGTGESLWP